MQRNWLPIIAILVVICAAGAYIFFSSIVPKPTPESEVTLDLENTAIEDIPLEDENVAPLNDVVTLDYCAKKTTAAEKSSCIRDVAFDKGDPGICAQITDSDVKYSCYRGIAVDKADLKICDMSAMDYTKYFCYLAVSTDSGDATICDKIPETNENTAYIKKTCVENGIRDNAIIAGDAEMCGQITSLITKYSCIEGVAHVTNDSTVCDRIPDAEPKQRCYKNFAINFGQPEICGTISDISIKTECLDYSYATLAFDTNDFAVCGRISDDFIRQSCIGDVNVQISE